MTHRDAYLDLALVSRIYRLSLTASALRWCDKNRTLSHDLACAAEVASELASHYALRAFEVGPETEA